MTTDKEQRSHEDRDVEVKQNPSAPREERVLKLLDSEIENVRDTETRHGWTSWGLIGAIIASLWLLSEEFKFGNLRLEVIATAVLIFSAFIDSLRWFAYLAWQVSAPKSEQVRFRWSNEFFSGSELTYFTEILRGNASQQYQSRKGIDKR